MGNCLCTCCGQDKGAFIHVMWSCAQITPYWMKRIDVLELVFQTTIHRTPVLSILAVLQDSMANCFPLGGTAASKI
ncbi:hypothetical protein XENTR_v10011496 [Xenopus tropicalis]|nr:hypothetical protein XENTR_v10011496 [Xenopus tropicalis]